MEEKSTKRKFVFIWLLCLSWAHAPSFAHAQTTPATQSRIENLLSLETVMLDESALKLTGAKRLRDGDNKTATRVVVESTQPLDLVFDFGDQPVTVDRLSLETKGLKKNQASIEVLVSTMSSTAGYRSLRTEPMNASGKLPQRFPFEPAAGRWVMIRITSADKKVDRLEFSIAELVVGGYVGTPKSVYKFDESPADAIKVLAKLSDSVQVNLSKDEELLIADAHDGKLDDFSFAEASLLSSGIVDSQMREPLLRKIDQMVAQCEKVIPKNGETFARGKLLLTSLHNGHLQNGYREKQTDVSAVLNDGTFNCVSSATLYAIVGRRIGLDVRGIEVPDHAFAIVYDGTDHADVETTNPHGFNPARNKLGLERFQQTTGFVYIPDNNRSKRREIDELGMVALTWYNHGVGAIERKEYDKALVNFFKALSLDPDNKSAVKNVLSVLGKWSHELFKAGDVEKAMSVLEVGRELAPDDRNLKHNQKAIWQLHIRQLVADDRADEALKQLTEACDRTESNELAELQSWVFIQQGERLVKNNEWESAVAVADNGLERVDESAQRGLQEWRESVLMRWTTTFVKEKDFAKAVDVIEKSGSGSNGWRLDKRLAYIAQEWSRQAKEAEGLEAGAAIAEDLVKRFPDNWQIKKVANAFTDRAANESLTAKDYETALTIYAAARKRDPDNYHFKQREENVWLVMVDPMIKSRDWKSSVDLLERGIKSLPNGHKLKKNLVYCVQEFGRDTSKEKGLAAGEALVAEMADRFPNEFQIQNLRGKQTAIEISRLVKAKQFKEAAEVLSENREAWKTPFEMGKSATFLFYQQCKPHFDAKQWDEAIVILGAAHKEFPKVAGIKTNLEFAWASKAKALLDAEQWEDAAQVYKDAIEMLPSAYKLKQNLEYCESKLKSDK